ncbi:hypothetical protein VTH06DRAFT_1680 [Thermothelomyces fergusii]
MSGGLVSNAEGSRRSSGPGSGPLRPTRSEPVAPKDRSEPATAEPPTAPTDYQRLQQQQQQQQPRQQQQQQQQQQDLLLDGATPAGSHSRAPPPVATNVATNGKARPWSGRETEPEPHDAQRQLNEYRENLARQMENRKSLPTRGGGQPAVLGSKRVSPIREECSPPSQPRSSSSGSEPLQTSVSTNSTGSGHTVRAWSATPGPMAATPPSFPFPRMAPSAFLPPPFHRPFTTLSPTVPPDGHRLPPDAFRSQDTLASASASSPSTPASNTTFLPPGCPHAVPDNPDFPSPNLYELALMLTAEPGLDAWWQTVVQIMVDVYKAERVTLAVPADPTDIENVPWGQKATYNAHRDDGLSMAYLARGSSLMPSSTDETAAELSARQACVRPVLQSRHSFTSYEQNRQPAEDDRAVPLSRRPHVLWRSQSHHPTAAHRSSDPAVYGDGLTGGSLASLNREALERHDAHEVHEAHEERQEIPSWEAPFSAPGRGHGKVLDVLQALDYEADPLIDHNGILRILDRGRVVALTRSYPYLNQEPGARKPVDAHTSSPGPRSPEGPRKRAVKPRANSMSKLSSILGNASFSPASGRSPRPPALERKFTLGPRVEEDETPKPPIPKYEEYEQAPPSPWSQSPAPSPAVRADPAENPFFTDAMVDEESFNPSSAGPADYSAMTAPEAIGVDNSWTVLHVPLTHVLLSRPHNPSFKLDPSAMEQKISTRKSGEPSPTANLSPERTVEEKHAPIAILSILSPIIPYPANLRHSLEHLAPLLATSFSLCRHYTNLETELNGLQKRRPQTAGFGALRSDGRPLAGPAAPGSFSCAAAEYAASRDSFAGSMTSPSDYSGPGRSAAGSPGGTPSWDASSLGGVVDGKRGGATPSPALAHADGYFCSVTNGGGPTHAGQRPRTSSRDTPLCEKRSSLRLSGSNGQPHDQAATASPTAVESRGAIEPVEECPPVGSRQRQPGAREKTADHAPGEKSSSAAPHRHTQLHSYGADFASTFQSLPPSSTIPRGIARPTPSRSGSMAQTDMTPPSDRLKGLILDSLPAHVFVALPQTGEIVWVNSRFLTYRGQTSAELAADPWGSIHPEDRDGYLREWSHCVRTGEQFARKVRIRRFDGAYRWFYARAVASKDKRGVIMQFLGSYMDIHDQHTAEVRAARQEEVLASEAKHRLLANLIPQIIFTATEDEGITFANEQWLSYTGQDSDQVLGLGFMDYVHPDDLAKCRIPPTERSGDDPDEGARSHGRSSSVDQTAAGQSGKRSPSPNSSGQQNNSKSGDDGDNGDGGRSDGTTDYVPTAANLSELAKKGVIKVSTDSSGRISYTTEIRLRSKSGEYRWHLIRCVEIDNVDFGNGASSYFGSATDINDLKLLETKLKEAMDSKGRFLSNMSHEIRTPLIGISGMVSFLQDTTLNEEQRDYTNTIQTSANSLLMIINDILDLSKVDAGMMKLNYEWFHTRSLIEDVNELVFTMAVAKRLELNYVVEEDVPAWVKGDKVRIRQVLLNVIGNAIKFTTKGEVFSKCRVFVPEGAARLRPDEIMLEFSIIDTGRGFTQEEAELMFKPFSQIDGSSTRQHGGSGLGLVISRQLVELHGGKMVGTAVPGKGSTFTFTARFGLPTEDDHPESWVPQPAAPGSMKATTALPAALPSASSSGVREQPSDSPSATRAPFVPPAPPSSGSSELSTTSSHSRTTDRSSATSVNAGIIRFSQAARASGQDLSQMKLEMPSDRSSPETTPTATPEDSTAEKQQQQQQQQQPKRKQLYHHHHHHHHYQQQVSPPMFSILVICPQSHSREATTKHIEMTLPKSVPHQITAVASVEEAHSFLGGEDPVRFTHVVVNLPTPEEVISLMDKISQSVSTTLSNTTILILSDTVQRQAVSKLVAGTKYEAMLSERNVTYIYKPVKPSRFAVIFDPAKERDLSIDHNRSTAQRLVEDQRQSYLEMERRMGGKGYRALLVEDNPVNQKVLQKYLKRVGLAVELAADGVECTEMVFSKGWGYYALILCDLHMPRKDGYQACREVRQWEAERGHGSLPIIALSANVMSDVQEKCVSAGFNDYVTKPVDFIDLSRALSKFF